MSPFWQVVAVVALTVLLAVLILRGVDRLLDRTWGR